MEKCLIAAISDDFALGKDNDLLWHLSEDLKYFKRQTLGHPVIMGRKTFDSIGRPLPKRLNIVLSRKGGEGLPEGVACVSSLEEAFALAEQAQFEGRVMEPKRCFVMGGGSIYAQALPLCDKLYLTEVHTLRPDADTFFPAFDKALWVEDSRSALFAEGDLSYEFVIYGR